MVGLNINNQKDENDMRNIFKTFKENKALIEENKLLKAQNDALMNYKESFDKFYRDTTNTKILLRYWDQIVEVTGIVSINEEYRSLPVSVYKDQIINDLTKKLSPFIEYDLRDDNYLSGNNKILVGKLKIATNRGEYF